MGIAINFKVMVSWPWIVLLVATTLVTLTSASICPQGKQYLSKKLEICVNCTHCDSEKGFVVLRPCEVHRDTLCGPVSEIWELQPGFHYRHNKHNKHRHKHKKDTIWNYDDDVKRVGVGGSSDNRQTEVVTVTSTQVPFSSAETLVWDWQAIALTLAVFACILFFLVIALYSFHQAKQWRRLKENFEADVEELSARLSLMAASSSEKGEILEPSLGPIHDGNYLNNRCVYLEQLLNVRKDTKIGSDAGNVYIEESNATSGKPSS